MYLRGMKFTVDAGRIELRLFWRWIGGASEMVNGLGIFQRRRKERASISCIPKRD